MSDKLLVETKRVYLLLVWGGKGSLNKSLLLLREFNADVLDSNEMVLIYRRRASQEPD